MKKPCPLSRFPILPLLVVALTASLIAAAPENGDAPGRIVAGWEDQIEKFRRMRKKYLIYPN